MSDIAIKVEHLTKTYRLYERNRDRIKEALNLFGTRYSRDFHALNDVSFEIKKGESIGILGRNGAGKSTLLKILTGVLTKTSGMVEVNDKIAALLELGAGFNPEMTGIENVYLNGTIMGFSKVEMDALLPEIIRFADIGKFIYQPVKMYSSGMLVRLAFAVQTQIDPKILIVDEALAVGDALFQKRCYQKINELVSKGTTFIFVSHDYELVRAMTTRAIFLVKGEIKSIGSSADVVRDYRRYLHDEEKLELEGILEKTELNNAVEIENDTTKVGSNATKIEANSENDKKIEESLNDKENSFGDFDAKIEKVYITGENGILKNIFYPNEEINIMVVFVALKDIEHLNVSLRLMNKQGVKMYSWGTLNQDIDAWNHGSNDDDRFWTKKFKKGDRVEVRFTANCNLGANLYEVQAALTEEKDRNYGDQRMLHWLDEANFFTVNVIRTKYFFGGVTDMKMKAEQTWIEEK